MSIKNIESELRSLEHMLLVLKRMKDDPQGDTPVLYRHGEDALMSAGRLWWATYTR